MTRTKRNAFKRIVVSILTLAIIAGNLANQVYIVKACEDGDTGYDMPIVEAAEEPVEEIDEIIEEEPVVTVQETEGDGYVLDTAPVETPEAADENTDATASENAEQGQTITYTVKYFDIHDVEMENEEKEFKAGDKLTFPKDHDDWRWETRKDDVVIPYDEKSIVTEDLELHAVVKDTTSEAVVDEPAAEQENVAAEIYSVVYFGLNGQEIETRTFEAGTALTFPSLDREFIWKDANEKVYTTQDVVKSNLSLYATVAETEATEETETEGKALVIKVVCIDEENQPLPGYSYNISESVAFDADGTPEIEGYKFIEARLNDVVIDGVNVVTGEEENAVSSYYYVVDGTENEIVANAIIALVYAAEDTIEPVINVVCADENGDPIENAATELPAFLGEMVLNDIEKAPIAVEGYDYVQARLGSLVIDGLVKEVAGEDAENPIYAWSYVVGEETVKIEQDTTLVLDYAQIPVAVEMKATIVDEFGDAIDEKYTEMDLPKFDAGDVLVLDDEENPPVDNVSVRQGLFKVTKYTYVQATFEEKIIKALKQELAKDGEGYCYSYTVDGEIWTPIKEDSTVVFEYTDGKKTVFTYEDAYVTVTATLQHAGAIPDDAEFVVTPITKKSTDYNYEAYMAALNAGSDSEEEPKFSDDNTLLYDIAFLSEDEEGNRIEVEPTEGSVNINMQFKAKQLVKEIEATSEEDVSVAHLPLNEGVKEANGTTADATAISAADIQVEPITASVSVKGEVIDFNVTDFSCYAVYNEGLKKYVYTPGTGHDYRSILGDAVSYGLVANTVSHNAHMDVNFAAGTLTGNANVTAGVFTGSHNPGNYIIGKYTGSGFFTDNGTYKNPFIVYTTEDAKAKFSNSLFANNPQLFVDTSYSEADLQGIVSGMVNGTLSAALATEENAKTYTNDSWMVKGKNHIDGWVNAIYDGQKYYLDLTASEPGTYYFNFAPGEYTAKMASASKLNISMNSDQNIVFNVPDANIKIWKFEIAIDGKNTGSDLNNGSADDYCRAVTWNLYNATDVRLDNMLGVVLAPKADAWIEGTSTGWLVCNKMVGNNGEWHGVWQEMPPTTIPDSLNLSAAKTVDGYAPANGEVFTFTLSKADENGNPVGEPLQTKENTTTGSISFDTITFDKAGTYWYVVKESSEKDGYVKDETKYIVKAVVTGSTNQAANKTTYTVAKTIYKNEVKDGNAVNEIKFNNEKKLEPGKITLTGKKRVNGSTPAANQKFTFTLQQYTKNDQWGPVKETVQNNGEDFSFPEMTFDGTGYTSISDDKTEAYYYFLISEKVEGGDYVYDGTKYIAKITAKKEGNKWVPTVKYFKFGPKETVSCREYAQKDQGTIVSTMTFNNSKAPEYTDEYKFYATKEMSGTWPEGATFTFRLEPIPHGQEGGANFVTKLGPLPNNKTGYIDVTVTKDKPVADFGTIKFPAVATNSGQVSGTYQSTRYECYMYKITEIIPPEAERIPGMVYSTRTQYIKVWHNTMRLSNGWVRTWVEVNGSDNLNECGGPLGPVNFLNKFSPVTTYVSGVKTWEDNNNNDNKRPTSITIRLLADGTEVDSAVVTASQDWKWSFNNLPKFKADGKTLINYTVKEDPIDGYTTEVNGYDVVNTHKPEKTVVYGSKTWVDNDNQDGVRPESIVITLFADGKKVDSKTVTAKEGWSWKFTDLPKYNNGNKIEYTITEDVIEGYTADVDADAVETEEGQKLDVVNRHTPGETGVKVKKVWDDNDNQDSNRPDSVEVQLYATANGNTTAVGEAVVLDDNNGWVYAWEKLPEKQNGAKIIYTVDEVKVPANYTKSISGDTTLYTITNKLVPKLIPLSGSKTWEDNDDQDGVRPESIKITLLADGEVVEGKTLTVTEANDWTWKFVDLPANKKGGEAINYSVSETMDEVSNEYYSAVVDGMDVINTHKTFKTSVDGVKTWDDKGNQDGKRPDEITVILMADGTEVQRTTVTEADDWKFEFTDLDKFRDGKEIKYTVAEVGVPEDYTVTVNGTNIKNSYTPGETSIEVRKEWDDDDNRDGLRPDKVSVQLYQQIEGNNGKAAVGSAVELTEENNWYYIWEKLPIKAAGKAITYSVEEVSRIRGYESSKSDDGFTITNKHIPETLNIEVEKEWDDDDNRDDVRPAKLEVALVADGEVTNKVITLNEGNNWSGSFKDLPVYKNVDGDVSEIEYSVKELMSEADALLYKLEEPIMKRVTVDGYKFKLKNVHDPKEIELSVDKVWMDDNDKDGNRPSKLEVQLWKKVGEKRSLVDTKTITVLNGGWSCKFTNLKEYEAGKKIYYYIVEDIIEYYTLSDEDSSRDEDENGNVIVKLVNKYTPDETERTVTKSWLDDDDRDGIRPESIMVQLYSDGNKQEKAYGDPVELNPGNDWTYTWEHLPVKLNGEKADYSVKELTQVPGYASGYNKDDKFILENKHEPKLIDIEGAKTWDDEEDNDGLRPESITIHLLADGVEIDSKVVTAKDGWKWSFTKLPKFNKGKEIVYTIEEDVVKDYTTSVDGYDVTNTHKPEYIDIEGEKTWDDNNNQAGARPASIVIRLLADGKEVDKKTVTAKDNWAWSFTHLPKYNKGVKITYTIVEDKIPNYTTTVNGYNVTNRYTPGKTSIEGSKVWDDQGNADGIRPSAVTIRLYRDGVYYASTQATVNNGWYYFFGNLDIAAADGHTYVYSVNEDAVPGYTTTVNGYTIINSHYPPPPPPETPPGPPPTTPPEEPDVLGARRTNVLGARRQKAVLGARRAPQTGDESRMAAWAMAMSASAAACAAWFGFRKKSKKS